MRIEYILFLSIVPRPVFAAHRFHQKRTTSMHALRIVLLSLLLPVTVTAGGGPDSTGLRGAPSGDVLRPLQLRGSSLYLGFDAGAQYAKYFGTHAYTVQSPFSPAMLWSKFDGGDGLGFVIRGVADIPVTPSLGVIAKLGYNSREDTYSGTFENPIFYLDPASGFPAPATLDGEIALTMEFLTIDLLLRYQLMPKTWYLLGGFTVSSLLGSSGSFAQTIVSPASVSYADTELLPTGVRSVTLSSFEAKGFNTPRFGLSLGVGTWIPLSQSAFLTPELSADYALNVFRDAAGQPLNFIPKSDVRFLTITLTAGLRFAL